MYAIVRSMDTVCGRQCLKLGPCTRTPIFIVRTLSGDVNVRSVDIVCGRHCLELGTCFSIRIGFMILDTF